MATHHNNHMFLLLFIILIKGSSTKMFKFNPNLPIATMLLGVNHLLEVTPKCLQKFPHVSYYMRQGLRESYPWCKKYFFDDFQVIVSSIQGIVCILKVLVKLLAYFLINNGTSSFTSNTLLILIIELN